MKKIISILLVVLCIASVCCGCSSGESWMPYDLKFGMTYDESQEAFEDIPELVKADSNDGYLTKTFFPEENDAKEFFGMDEEYPTLSYSFSFNEDKELYEFMVIAQFLTEGRAENLAESLCEYYNEKMGVEPEVNKSLNTREAVWENEEVGISLCMIEDDDDCTVYAVVHNKEFELK